MSRVFNFSAGPAVLPEAVLKELADEMISELTDELSSELGSVKTVLNAGRSYDNFSGIAGGMSGTVKFIYKTELGTDR